MSPKKTDKVADSGELPPTTEGAAAGQAPPPPSPPGPASAGGGDESDDADEQSRGGITMHKVRNKDQYLALDENDDQIAIVKKHGPRAWHVRFIDRHELKPEPFGSSAAACAYIFGVCDTIKEFGW